MTPRCEPELLAALAADLGAGQYTVDGVAAVLGPTASAALGREQPLPALRATADAKEPAAVLARLWVLGCAVDRDLVAAALPRTGVDGAAALGLLTDEAQVRPLVDLRPYAADDHHWWLASDLSELATGEPLRPDHVLGVGGASATLARWTPRRPVGRALDVGTGCGVQAFHLATHADRVTGTDLSARCLDYAAFNAGLNAAVPDGPFAGRRLELHRGDLFGPVGGERFDLVVSNPPFVITPRVEDVPRYAYRDGLRAGDSLVAEFVRGVGAVLAPGGIAQLLGNWEIPRGAAWTERVGEWLASSGLDGWVIQREVSDPAEYAETWVRDGGQRPGDGEYEAMYAAWLDDFAARDVEAVGFGVLTLHRPETERPAFRVCEEMYERLDGGLGEAVAGSIAARCWLADSNDDRVLGQRYAVATDVTEERFGRPGEEHPAVIRLRQGGGLGRAVTADTALAGFVGGCTGELTAAQIVAALGSLLDEPIDDLRGRIVPAVRELIATGFLHLAG